MASGDCYPGSTASANNVICLAEEFRKDAKRLLSEKQGRPFVSDAPGRLLAVHAIELYLNAFLLSLGLASKEIRSSRHDLAEKARMAIEGGLVLRQRTNIHLERMMRDREYLALRYDPDTASTSQITRLWATLDEVARKVKQAVGGQRVPPESLSA